MQKLESYGQMWGHLKLMLVTMLFHPVAWLAMGGVYIVGWIFGRSFRSHGLSSIFIGMYLASSILVFVFKGSGWDLLILAGIPFLLGVYIGSKKN